MELVERYQPALVRLAQSFVPSRAVAEEVAQETWLGVLNGIDRFEGRSSLKTWIFRILVNRAKTRGERESRSVPFSSLEREDGEPVVDPDRFGADGAWSSPPRSWEGEPEGRLLAGEDGASMDGAALTERGEEFASRVVAARREQLNADLADETANRDPEVARLLHRLARELAGERP